MSRRRMIELRYKCACMPKEVGVHMLERGRGEDIEDFMNRVTLTVSIDHRKRSVLCWTDKTEYVKIPTEGDVVGGGKGGTA